MKSKYELLETRPETSGRITIDLIMLEETRGEYNQSIWKQTLCTQVITMNEITSISRHPEGLSIMMRPNSTGACDLLFWPWTAIQHYTITTNTDAEDASIAEWAKEEQLEAYAERGTDFLEDLLNHSGPHGPGCDCPPDDEMLDDDGPVVLDLPYQDTYIILEIDTPCNHGMALKSNNDRYTCIVCATQWETD